MLRMKDIFRVSNLYVFIGLGGVDDREPARARRWGRVFAHLVVFIAILLLIDWQVELKDVIRTPRNFVVSWVVWIFFAGQFSILMILVKDRLRYIRQNWLLPLIIVIGIPFILDITSVIDVLTNLKPLLAIIVMIPALGLLSRFFMDGQLRTTLLAAAIIVVVFGVLVAGVDPNIKTAWDGIWWALATVSTVGYGDVVPSSLLGRMIAALLVIMGLGVFVVITANFLTLSLRREEEAFHDEEHEVKQILREVRETRAMQNDTMRMLKMVMSRLDKIEKRRRE